MVKLCYRLIKSGKDSPLFLSALVLLRSLLAEGNTYCQEALQEYMCSPAAGDTEGQFFRAIFETVQAASTWTATNQRRRQSNNSVDQTIMGAAQKAEIEIFDNTLMFAKEFCEGHNRKSQDILRVQSFNRRTYNIIGAVNDLLDTLAPRRDIYESMGMMPYTVLCSTLDLLVESIQGPCPENQVLCVQKKAIEVCKQIITTHTLPNVADGAKFDSRFRAIILLSSLLENRHDRDIEKLMASKIESFKFNEFGMELAKELDKSKVIAKDKKKLVKLNALSGDDNDSEDEESDEEDGGEEHGSEEHDLKSVHTVYAKFDPAADVENHVSELKQVITCLYHVTKCLEPEYAVVESHKTEEGEHVKDQFKSMMCEVDISWNGKVETIIFAVPDEATDLSETTKEQFLNTCDLSTRETRVKALMEEAENFQNEMEAYNELAQFEFYGWLLDHYFLFKAVTLVFVALLVVNVLFSHTNSTHTVTNHRNYATKLFSFILSGISVVGYFTMFLYWLIPQVFIAWKVNKERLMLMRSEMKSGKIVQTWEYNWTTMLLPFSTMPVLVLVCIMHYTAYTDVLDASTGFLLSRYLLLALVLYGIWLPIAFRSAILTPNNFIEEVFCIVYDLLAVPAIFEHLGCTLLLLLGYNYLYFYAFVLLDIVSMSEHMKNAVRAVTRPMSSLCSVFILFVLVVLIFAIIGYFVFDDAFIINGEELEVDDGGVVSGKDNLFCSSPLGCFWTVAYGGVRAGDIAEIMTDISPDQNHHYFARILFDMAFFIILGVLLFDMVTGIIVDTFVSLREETVEREDTLKNEVFISGKFLLQDLATNVGRNASCVYDFSFCLELM